MEREFDLIVFGATGYTGSYCIEYMVKCLQNEAKNYKWAVAGRSEEKLRRTKDEVSKLINHDLSSIPVIVADLNDEQSLENMCKRCKVLLNCVGPYRDYGEPVTRACIKTKTHQVDVAGEPQYTEKMQLLYHKEAENAGVYIVNACGFDSIPCDIGVCFLKDKFKPKQLNSIETYADMSSGPSGNVINHGTWDSAVGAFRNWNEVSKVRRRLFTEFYKKPFPPFKYRISSKLLPFISPEVNKWCIPFWETDKAVVNRTQLFNYINFDEKPVQLVTYMAVPNFLHIIGLALVGLIFLIFTRFECGAKLLKDYPHLFTFGNVSKEGPSRTQVLESNFRMFLVGKGWSEEKGEESNHPPDKKLMAVVKGQNPAYIATSICLIVSAFTILEESANFPIKGGVLTPGVVFRNSQIIERLNRNSVTFEIVES
ncbi:hypothetical protein B4U79_08761 [Dinothrombium tinctorium]|uniref:Saccharopine dehydrogenase NADP binding domain-containing protein n=1 Tax=Dinothrombium tinctorium TaxID=1965070 RepID=A0A443QTL6_9ACAR|nr:hypothetical protein B4U79_08761 [Dinothrombium tinctorium]